MVQTSFSFDQTLAPKEGDFILSEVLSALTFALDLTEGAVPGHSLRTCLLGMRLAAAMQLPEQDVMDLYYALLLKDIGCADTVTRLSRIMCAGDNGPWSLTGWAGHFGTNPLLLAHVWREVLPEIPLPGRIGQMLSSSLENEIHEGLQAQSSTSTQRDAETMLLLGMGEKTMEAVLHIDERWDGSGTPARKRAFQIPLLARICAVAQSLDACAAEHGSETALGMVRNRRGTWFDPEVVRIAQKLHTSGKLWPQCHKSDVEATRTEVLRLDASASCRLTTEHLDRICEAFGNVVDSKTPFTFHHSVGVTEVAVSLARELDLAPERVTLVRRAAFLHDIGKLAVPNRILDKQGRLTAQEWAVVKRHPQLSGSILAQVGAFREIAALAAEHHERLDGSGYPFGLRAEQISLESRVIAIADCYSAMAEDRPYRQGMEAETILQELQKDTPSKLEEACLQALHVCTNRWGSRMPAHQFPPKLGSAKATSVPKAKAAALRRAS